MNFSALRQLACAAIASIAASHSALGQCPTDLNSDGSTNATDLSFLLAAWGQPGSTDVNGDGSTNATDLSFLLAAWGPCPKPSPTFFTGVVLLADGTPVADAVVVTDLGGTATSGTAGAYELELVLQEPVDSVTVSAIASIGGTTYQGSRVVSPVTVGEVNEVDPIVVESEDECTDGFGWLPGFAVLGTNGAVRALTVFDDGTGPRLYAGGAFTTAGGVTANRIARWNGTSWSAVGSGMNGSVSTLVSFDDGSGGGPRLYAGGSFTTAGGVPANRIARWNGTSWSAVGSGMNGLVSALTVFDDGTGPRLYAGGEFTSAGGVTVNLIARWNGASWSAVGTGFMAEWVSALTVFDDGTGPALYAGGGGFGFNQMRIARWNGTSWSSLPTGMGTASPSALAGFDDGTGPALYAGGNFTIVRGFTTANRIIRWSGTSWSTVGSGMNNTVLALTVFDDGTGPALYAGGEFTTAGGGTSNRIARWNGTSWSPVGSGMNGRVSALTVFDDGTGPALFAGGDFTTAGGVASGRIAKWGCTDP